MELIKRFWEQEEGADAAEYALVIGLVAIAIVAGAFALGGNLSNAFKNVSNCVATQTGNSPTGTC
jgi:pilus assembly protein Flp/PilA